ncbi:MAG: hypothetical protein ACYS26_13360 [Planctomycetota bacterium]
MSAPGEPLLGLPSPAAWEALPPPRALDLHFEALGERLGPDLQGYRNHCQRVLVNFRALAPRLDPRPTVVALVFHDIALWTHRTVAYIEPSAGLAREHVARIDRPELLGPVDAPAK